ncbi:N-acetyltransferase [Paenibacillus aurantius]|uniref:N-acetyltransferase n=1 Tax=Paenibacillus aurantius TaxID=2918900 RepID=A0AA96RI18_9BACL|nr:N-acetyltransferase [Paenibacillus aurantius]
MIIRTETEKDYGGIREVNIRAFGNREDEANLVDRIRKSKGFLPSLSLVAEEEGTIIGHLLISKAEVVGEGSVHEVLVLAPIAVEPSRQKQGIGGRLIEEGLSRCRQLDYDVLLLIGHPEYYPRFGFRPARPLGLELKQFPVPDEVFMGLELKEGGWSRVRGELKYPEAFL